MNLTVENKVINDIQCPNCGQVDCDGILYQNCDPVSFLLGSPPTIETICIGKRIEILKDNDDRPYFVLVYGHGMCQRIALKRI